MRILLEASTNYSLLCPVSSTPQPQNDFEVWTKVFRCTVYWGCVLLDVTFWWFSSVGCSLNPYKSFLLERKRCKNLRGFNLSRNVHDASKRKVFYLYNSLKVGYSKLDAKIWASFRCAFVCRPPYIDRDQIRTLRINPKGGQPACQGASTSMGCLFFQDKKIFLYI